MTSTTGITAVPRGQPAERDRPPVGRWAVALQSVKPVARSMRWSPLVGVTGVALLLVGMLRPEGSDLTGTIGSLRLSAYLLAAGAALAIDDRAGPTLASSPTPLALRRGVRLVIGLTPVALSWGLLLGAAWAVSGAEWSQLPAVALTAEAVGMVAFTVATAAIAAGRADGVGGSAGPPALTLLVVGLLMAQMRWPKHLTMFPMAPGDPIWTLAHRQWGVLALAAAGVVVGASLDPARRRRRRFGLQADRVAVAQG